MITKLQKTISDKLNNFGRWRLDSYVCTLYYPFEDDRHWEMIRIFDCNEIVFFMPKARSGEYIKEEEVDYYFNMGKKHFKLLNFK